MTKISIDTNQLKNPQENMVTVSKDIKVLSERLDTIGNTLPFSFTEKEKIVNKIRSISEAMSSQSYQCSLLSSCLLEISSLYEKTENTIVTGSKQEKNKLDNSSVDDADGTTTTFDNDPSNGGYGGDQGDMAHNEIGFQFLFWRWFENEELFDFVRRYPQYAGYSQNEIAELMKQMNQEGCGYISMVNAIFVQYEGREEEFEAIFGFPMYDENGEANYNRLFIDIYATTDDKYYLDETYGDTGLLNQLSISMTDEEFIAQFGCPPTDENGYFTQEAYAAVLAEYGDQSPVTIPGSNNNRYTIENRLNGYLNEKGISATTSHSTTLTPSDVDSFIDNGSTVSIGAVGFNLYDENGNVLCKDVGGHEMTITGVTDDGRYIVSSWGEKYYMNPSELNMDNTHFIIVDFK